MGDFNDYELAPALLEMTEANGRLTNVLLQVPDEERYSFVFSGVSQLIDALLLSPALVDQVITVQIMHVNADYPDAFGQEVTPSRMPYRATDHDLPLLVLALERQAATATPPLPVKEEAAAGGVTWLGIGLVGIAAAALLFFVRRRS